MLSCVEFGLYYMFATRLKASIRPILMMLWFKLMWVIAVIWQNQFEWMLIALLGAFVLYVGKPVRELTYCLVGGAIGILSDSLLRIAGLYQYSPEPSLPIPLWHMCIWLALVLVLRHAMRFLLSRIFFASFLSSVVGPIAYFAAMLLGAVSLPYGIHITALVLAASWFLCIFSIIFTINLIELDSSRARAVYIGSFRRLIASKML